MDKILQIKTFRHTPRKMLTFSYNFKDTIFFRNYFYLKSCIKMLGNQSFNIIPSPTPCKKINERKFFTNMIIKTITYKHYNQPHCLFLQNQLSFLDCSYLDILYNCQSESSQNCPCSNLWDIGHNLCHSGIHQGDSILTIKKKIT